MGRDAGEPTEAVPPCGKSLRARRLTALALAAILALALSACGSSGEDTDSNGGATKNLKPPPAGFFGVDSQDTLDEDDYAEMAKAGVGTLRTNLVWQQTQPESGDSFDFSAFDETLRSASRNGIKVLPYLYGTPPWAAAYLDKRDCAPSCTAYAPTSDFALQAWGNFVSAAAERYGPGGKFWKENPGLDAEPIRDWQIWNEQNSKTFYRPKPDPASYEKLLGTASDAIRAVDPKATIILGGMFGTPGGGDPKRSIPAATYLHELLKNPEAKDDFDGIALHPYSPSIESVREQVEIARQEMEDSGDPDVSLWVTEIGWSSGKDDNPLNVGSEKAQAERVTDVYRLLAENRDEWNVELVAWFAWQDSHASDAFCFFCAKAGLTTEDGKPKQALDAYSKAAGKQ